MNPETKIILIVCDNVQRTLSRYLHILHLNPSAIQRQQKEEKVMPKSKNIIPKSFKPLFR